MPSDPVAPSWPSGRWFFTPAATTTVREQCRYCMGGGEINGCPCPGGCDNGVVTAAVPAKKRK
jgi:hypothetical protein